MLTSIRIYNKNLYYCSFKLIQVNITKKYTKKLKYYIFLDKWKKDNKLIRS